MECKQIQDMHKQVEKLGKKYQNFLKLWHILPPERPKVYDSMMFLIIFY